METSDSAQVIALVNLYLLQWHRLCLLAIYDSLYGDGALLIATNYFSENQKDVT